ncbi:MAG: crossover junction endodeoxyribonuclease RuvC [Anaerolineae bacterium]|jgi:crossover junction endodeoxyribonuclease RuvC|nr:crossover junction endodeoxyribonuclease RuvC [Anaerolineae bacterium]
MRTLGIDPGTAITGYAIIEEDGAALRLVTLGAIETPAKTPMPQRLQTIYTMVSMLIHEHAPDAAAVEELFFSRNVTTAISVGQARGVVLLALAEAGLPTAEYTPLQVKQAVTGYGNAGKRQVQEMVKVLLNLTEIPRPDDAADAAAVAICHLHRAHLDRLMQG